MKLERLAGLGATLVMLATIGCSDPVPPPAQASLLFVVGQPGVPGVGCAIGGSQAANIGGPPAPARGDPGARAVDGQDDTSIGCRVSGGGAFSISGSALRGVTSFSITNGTAPAGGRGEARISVSSPATAGKVLTSAADRPCTLFLDRTPFQVAPGNIWADFDCDLAVNASQPGSQCGITGNFVFENCEE